MAPLMSLWGDGWFYVSGGGFLVSCLLFVFLLGQYKAAVEAEEEREEAPASASAAPAAEKLYIPRPIEPVVRIPETTPSVESIPSIIAPVMKTAPSPSASAETTAQAEAPKPVEKKKSEATTTGGLSPAVVYLQNLKTQVDHLNQEIELLKGLASQQSAQGELILNRLSELGRRLEDIEAPAPAPASEPVAEAAPEPAAVDSTIVIEPPASTAATADGEPDQAAAEAPVQEAAPEPEPEPKPARKGPVWPI